MQKNSKENFYVAKAYAFSTVLTVSLAGFISPVNISVLHNKGIFIIMKFTCALNSIKVKRIKKEIYNEYYFGFGVSEKKGDT